MARDKIKKRSIALKAKLSGKQKTALHKYLDSIYYDLTSGAGYSSAATLLKEVKRRGYYKNLGLNRITNYLKQQKAYSLYKPARTRFPTPARPRNEV